MKKISNSDKWFCRVPRFLVHSLHCEHNTSFFLVLMWSGSSNSITDHYIERAHKRFNSGKNFLTLTCNYIYFCRLLSVWSLHGQTLIKNECVSAQIQSICRGASQITMYMFEPHAFSRPTCHVSEFWTFPHFLCSAPLREHRFDMHDPTFGWPWERDTQHVTFEHDSVSILVVEGVSLRSNDSPYLCGPCKR